MTIDTSERGLERLICTALTSSPCDLVFVQVRVLRECRAIDAAGSFCGEPADHQPMPVSS